MKLLFLCGGLEPGRNGVGDYTRRLAVECIRQGQHCAVLALNDRSVESPTQRSSAERDFCDSPGLHSTIKECGDPLRMGMQLPLLRLPQSLPWRKRMLLARDFAQDLAPDWVSLQFVPYGYHPKGFCRKLGSRADQIAGAAKRHVFFHELTLGLHHEECAINRLNGVIQRACLRRFLKDWNPSVIQTHTVPYLTKLRGMGYSAKLLPLFGNIPVSSVEPVHPEFDAWVEQRRASPDKFLFCGYFGNFYPGAANTEFLSLLERLSKKLGRPIVCFLAGRQPPEALARWKRTAVAQGECLQWCWLGALSERQVSSYLQQLDFGIAATPHALIGKSGSAATMQDHGLPVLVPRNDWTPQLAGQPQPTEALRVDGFIPAWDSNFVEDTSWLTQRKRPADSCAVIAEQFLASLSVH